MQTPGQTRDVKIDEQPFPDPHTKSILMDCAHKENGNFDFTGGSFHFKSTFWHYLTLIVTSEQEWTMWARAMLTGHCSNTDCCVFCFMVLLFPALERLWEKREKLPEALPMPSGANARGSSMNPLLAEAGHIRDRGSTSGIKGLKRGKCCSRVAITKEKGENM